MSQARKVVVLDYELAEISNAIGAAAVLIELGTMLQYPDAETERQAPHFALGTLNLARARLLLVERTLRGDLDPRLLLSSFNTMPDTKDVARDHLVVLRPFQKPAVPKAQTKGKKTTKRKPNSRPRRESHSGGVNVKTTPTAVSR